jgi:colicin import membrane protein
MSTEAKTVADAMHNGSVIHESAFWDVAGGVAAVEAELKKAGHELVLDAATKSYRVKAPKLPLTPAEEAAAKAKADAAVKAKADADAKAKADEASKAKPEAAPMFEESKG